MTEDIKEKKTYLKKFMETKGEELKKQKVCEICNGKYTYFNKSHHNKSSKHKQALIMYEITNNKIKELESVIFNLNSEKEIKELKIQKAYEIVTDDIIDNGLSSDNSSFDDNESKESL
jgi:hypothetical protein